MAKIKNLLSDKIYENKLPLVIGYFNCIHIMHYKLLTNSKHFNILTFNDFNPKTKNRIYDFNSRIMHLIEFKPNIIYIYDINKLNLCAIDFIRKFLFEINPTKIIVGSNFKFGSDNKSTNLLEKYFNVKLIKYNNNISTTKIVSLLKNGEVECANKYLFKPYYYESTQLVGKKIGRKISFPTINLALKNHVCLPSGTYITTTYFLNKCYESISFIGKSKTTNSKSTTFETHLLLNHNKKIKILPNKKIKVVFLKFLRKNKKFLSLESLKQQLTIDKKYAISFFNKFKKI